MPIFVIPAADDVQISPIAEINQTCLAAFDMWHKPQIHDLVPSARRCCHNLKLLQNSISPVIPVPITIFKKDCRTKLKVEVISSQLLRAPCQSVILPNSLFRQLVLAVGETQHSTPVMEGKPRPNAANHDLVSELAQQL